MDSLTTFTQASLHSVSGQSLAILMVVQLVKDLPILHAIPTRALAVLIGMVIALAMATPFSLNLPDLTLTLLNGVVAAMAAVGGWHLVQSGKQ